MADAKTLNRNVRRVYSGILPPYWDRVSVAYPDDTTEVYTYFLTTIPDDTTPTREIQAIIEVTYADATKEDITLVDKTFQKATAY